MYWGSVGQLQILDGLSLAIIGFALLAGVFFLKWRWTQHRLSNALKRLNQHEQWIALIIEKAHEMEEHAADDFVAFHCQIDGINLSVRSKHWDQPFAYVSLMYGNSSDIFISLMVLGFSLQVRHQTKYPLILMHTDDVPQQYLNSLQQLFTLHQVEPIGFNCKRVRETSRIDLFGNYGNVFLKLRALQMTHFQKVLFLDADILIRKPLDKLFELSAPAGVEVDIVSVPEPIGHVIPAWKLINSWGKISVRINAGVLLLEPNENTFRVLSQQLEMSGPSPGCGSFCADEDFLTLQWAAKPSWTSLGLEHNLEMWRSYIVTPQEIESAAVFHFSAKWAKPFWVVRYPWAPSAEIYATTHHWFESRGIQDPNGLLSIAACEWAQVFKQLSAWAYSQGIELDR